MYKEIIRTTREKKSELCGFNIFIDLEHISLPTKLISEINLTFSRGVEVHLWIIYEKNVTQVTEKVSLRESSEDFIFQYKSKTILPSI